MAHRNEVCVDRADVTPHHLDPDGGFGRGSRGHGHIVIAQLSTGQRRKGVSLAQRGSNIACAPFPEKYSLDNVSMAMGYLLLTCRLESSEATIDKAAPIVGVEPSALDPDFGVVLIDPAGNRYAMMVDERDVGQCPGARRCRGSLRKPEDRSRRDLLSQSPA